MTLKTKTNWLTKYYLKQSNITYQEKAMLDEDMREGVGSIVKNPAAVHQICSVVIPPVRNRGGPLYLTITHSSP